MEMRWKGDGSRCVHQITVDDKMDKRKSDSEDQMATRVQEKKEHKKD